MAKKIVVPKLQEDIQTDEDLFAFLEYPGLLVLDIYSEWCGPCVAMVSFLRKIKIELGGGTMLQFATVVNCVKCKADTIEVFKRFRTRSEPKWLFIQNRKAVNLLFGCDAPQLLDLIRFEFRRLGGYVPTYYELDEYQPEEAWERQMKEDAINRAIAYEEEQKELKRLNYLNEVTDIIMENLPDIGVTIFGPQIKRNNVKKILQRAEQLKMQCKDRISVEICRKDFDTIHFACPNPIPDDVLEQLQGKEVLVCFWKVLGTGSVVVKLLQELAHDLQTTHQINPDDPDDIGPPLLEPMDVKVEIECEDGDICSDDSEEKLVDEYFDEYEDGGEEEEELEENYEDEDNVQLFDMDIGMDLLGLNGDELIEEGPKKRTRSKKVRLPPIWVPSNHRTHAALIYMYFRNQTKAFLPPDPEPEPPYVIMAFDTHKKKDLILHAERYKNDIPVYGFFTSDDADEANYIASSVNRYKRVTTNDKLVLKVKKATSHTMLSLVTYGPSYVSPSPLVGQEEATKFFPSTYKTAAEEDAEEEAQRLEEKEQASKKKQARKQKKPETENRTQTAEIPVQIAEVVTNSVSAENAAEAA